MTREERKIVALTGCSHALSHAYLLIFPAVLLLLKDEFSVGYFGLGVLSNIMTFAYGLGSLPGGMIYNRFGPKKLYLFCFLGSAAASLLVALSPNFVLFAAGLTVLGALGSILGRGTSSSLGKMAAEMVTSGVFMKFSRQAEREADRLGARMLYDSGFQPKGMAVIPRHREVCNVFIQ